MSADVTTRRSYDSALNVHPHRTHRSPMPMIQPWSMPDLLGAHAYVGAVNHPEGGTTARSLQREA